MVTSENLDEPELNPDLTKWNSDNSDGITFDSKAVKEKDPEEIEEENNNSDP